MAAFARGVGGGSNSKIGKSAFADNPEEWFDPCELFDPAHKSAVAELGIDVRKVVAQESDPVEAVLRYQSKHPADFIVLATTQRDGRKSRHLPESGDWAVTNRGRPI